MKKFIYILCFALTLVTIKAQNWYTTLNGGSGLKLGTSSEHPLNFYTYNRQMMSLSTHGVLKLDSLAGVDDGMLGISTDGSVFKLPNVYTFSTCIPNSIPWSQGGNYTANSNIGTCDNYDFILKANNKQSLFIKTNGYVGVGLNNSSPSAPFDVNDGTNSSTDHLTFWGNADGVMQSTADMSMYYNTANGFSIFEGSYTSGSPSIKLSISGANTYLSNHLNVSGNYIGSGSISGSYILSSSATSSNQALAVYNTTAAKTNFVVYNSGKTIIGDQKQTSPSSHTGAMLSVYGKIVSKELILTQQNWADYVFSSEYKLQSLENLEKYIWQNKHLPNVPSANEIEKDGANIAEINRIQMEKIEELTLYVIELKKEIEAIKKEIEK